MPTGILLAQPHDPPLVRFPVAVAVVFCAVVSGWLVGDGFGLGPVLAAGGIAVAGGLAARSAGRRLRAWNAVWAASAFALVVTTAWRGEAWPGWFAVFGALGLASLALHGGGTWRGVLVSQVSALLSLPNAVMWGLRGTRQLPVPARRLWRPIGVGAGAAVVLVTVFAWLFGSADPAFAHGLGSLTSGLFDWSPRPLFFGLLGAVGALTAAHSGAAPWRWDRYPRSEAKPRGLLEWAIPLLALDALFVAFDVVQVSVLFGGYRSVLKSTGMSYADYARQGFWQLLAATLLTLGVIALALRWAPRSSPRDATMVTIVLGMLCALALVVVGSALRRMQMDIDAYGLTRPRIAVVAIELWLGVVFLLLMAARCRIRSPWLPRAIVASAALTMIVHSAIGPDRLIARYNVDRYLHGHPIDLDYLGNLDDDAVPAISRLPEPQRSCVLRQISVDVSQPWYATTLATYGALGALEERPVMADAACGHPEQDGSG